jgi:hypothetical protein
MHSFLQAAASFAATLSTLGAFAFILVLARLRAPLTAAIFLGAVLAGALFGLTPGPLARLFLHGAIHPDTIGLAILTTLLLGLTATLQATGEMEKIVGLAQAFFRRPAITMAALPALIGLLPMPGGALFSAPMVASAAAAKPVQAGLLSAINYWFRHVWEHWWPLYPGVILAMSLTQATPLKWVAVMLPMGAVMILAGLLILARVHPELRATSRKPSPGVKRQLLTAISPIWIIILAYLLFWRLLKLLAPSFRATDVGGALAKFGPISLGVIVSLVWTSLRTRLSRPQLRAVWTRRSTYAMTLLVISVMLFKNTLDHVEAPGRIGQELTAASVPMAAVVAALPFIAGMVTGLAIGFVGTAFPIILGLIPAGQSLWPYAMLGYAFGHMGQMLSPIHMCHVVSNRYFGTPFGPVYRHILPSAALDILGAAAYFLLLKWLMN